MDHRNRSESNMRSKNGRDTEELFRIAPKRRSYGYSEVQRFERALVTMRRAHELNDKYLEFIQDVKENFVLFWTFYTIAKHYQSEGFEQYSQMDITGQMRRHTKVADSVRSGFKVNNNSGKYLAKLAIIYDPSLVGFFEFRVKKNKQEVLKTDADWERAHRCPTCYRELPFCMCHKKENGDPSNQNSVVVEKLCKTSGKNVDNSHSSPGSLFDAHKQQGD